MVRRGHSPLVGVLLDAAGLGWAGHTQASVRVVEDRGGVVSSSAVRWIYECVYTAQDAPEDWLTLLSTLMLNIWVNAEQ